MPFTFAHPAIVLPFNYCSKRYISLTGVIAGSLVPDFEYFLRMRVKSVYSHTLSGLFWFDLPLALILAFLFHYIVRNQLIVHLPSFLYKRLQAYTLFDWHQRFKRSWIVVIISVLLGTVSHITWDGFTHTGGFFVKHIPLLQSLWSSVPVYKILQHGSSLIGILIIAWSLYQLPIASISNKVQNAFRFWFYIAMITSVILLTKIIFTNESMLIGNLVVSGISAFLLALTIVSFHFKQKENGPL